MPNQKSLLLFLNLTHIIIVDIILVVRKGTFLLLILAGKSKTTRRLSIWYENSCRIINAKKSHVYNWNA